MIDLYNITAFAAFVFSLLVALAFMPHLLQLHSKAARSIAWGFCLIAAGSIGRTNYWANMRVLLGDDWQAFRDAIGNLNVNIGFDMLLITGLYLLLRARLLLIPEDEREKWNIITCIWYPNPPSFPILWRRK